MIVRNESCGAEQMPMSYLTCLLYILEGWTGVEHLDEYLSYLAYLTWLFAPLLVAFLLPAIILILVYVSIFILHIYKLRTHLKEVYANDFWDGARLTVTTMWYVHARIWNENVSPERGRDGMKRTKAIAILAGHYNSSTEQESFLWRWTLLILTAFIKECTSYELHGLEKIPDGPALFVFYHGATPLDFFYFMSAVLAKKKKFIHVVADHFVFSLPGFKILVDVFSALPGSQEECTKALKNGRTLAISPGGVREALFSNECYTMLWGNRKGFAQVAIDAKVPIIPFFTQNIRESVRTLGGLKPLRWVYENTRLPLVPLYGNFPVKLRTYVGDPIPYDPNVTAAELAEKAKNAVQCLIDKHQKIPGNVFRALMERFETHRKED